MCKSFDLKEEGKSDDDTEAGEANISVNVRYFQIMKKKKSRLALDKNLVTSHSAPLTSFSCAQSSVNNVVG